MERGSGLFQSFEGDVLNNAGPFAGQLGVGAISGYCSGVALKTFGRGAATLAGAGFMLVQGLAYSGYLDVKWSKVERDVLVALDVDRDGKLTAADAQLLFNKLQSVLKFNVPGASGFSAGLVYAISGGIVRTAVAAGAVSAGTVLSTAHMYTNSDWFHSVLKRTAPDLSEKLEAKMDRSAYTRGMEQLARLRDRTGRSVSGILRGDSGGGESYGLEALRREEAKLRQERDVLAAERALSARKRDVLARINADITAIEQAKKAVKAVRKRRKE